jgi:outer membrane immunogenic protein
MKLASCFVGIAAMIATPAFAADMAVKAPPPAPAVAPAPFSWTGIYIGMNGGYARSTASETFVIANNVGTVLPPVPGFAERGDFFGGQVGAN